jgi:hypothetical protein
MFENLLKKHPLDEQTKNNIVHDFVNYLAHSDREKTAPQVARDLHKNIREMIKNDDPYHEEKQYHNQFMLTHYPALQKKVTESDNPFETALRIAIAGNIIDFGPAQDFDIMETINNTLKSDFAIDQSGELQNDIQTAKTILYLGDNAGEIVADKLFIETLNHPNLYFATRGAPIINDITIEDAIQTEIDKTANIISNGYDAPSTILDKVSEEFMEIYKKADIIISKGQGNLEGLINEKSPKIYFLLTVKCQLIGDLIGVRKGDFVVVSNYLIHQSRKEPA